MTWILLIVIAAPGITSTYATQPFAVGEYATLEACQAAIAAIASANYSFRGYDWHPFNDGAICIEHPAPQAVKP